MTSSFTPWSVDERVHHLEGEPADVGDPARTVRLVGGVAHVDDASAGSWSSTARATVRPPTPLSKMPSGASTPHRLPASGFVKGAPPRVAAGPSQTGRWATRTAAKGSRPAALAQHARLLECDQARTVDDIGPAIAQVGHATHLAGVVPPEIAPDLPCPVVTEPAVQFDMQTPLFQDDVEVFRAISQPPKLTTPRRQPVCPAQPCIADLQRRLRAPGQVRQRIEHDPSPPGPRPGIQSLAQLAWRRPSLAQRVCHQTESRVSAAATGEQIEDGPLDPGPCGLRDGMPVALVEGAGTVDPQSGLIAYVSRVAGREMDAVRLGAKPVLGTGRLVTEHSAGAGVQKRGELGGAQRNRTAEGHEHARVRRLPATGRNEVRNPVIAESGRSALVEVNRSAGRLAEVQEVGVAPRIEHLPSLAARPHALNASG